ncbi:MAG TPA: hypothetical protein GX706_02925 [Candidatus Moranbacteria bacterium]|nr:hypothetical protein [Candidatus Moranbacteria bacterium]
MKRPEEKSSQVWKPPKDWILSEEEYNKKVKELNQQLANRTEAEKLESAQWFFDSGQIPRPEEE